MKDYSIFQNIKELVKDGVQLRFESDVYRISYKVYKKIDDAWIYQLSIAVKKESNKALFDRALNAIFCNK